MPVRIPDTLDALLVPIDAVRPDPANYNQHSAAQIEQIAASLVAFGFDQPILARRNGLIIAGHGRLLAARQVGMTHVPVVYTDLDGVDAARRMIGDNRLAALAEPDAGALAELLRQLQAEDALGGTGYDDAAVDALLKEVGGATPADDPGPQVDKAAELQAKWGTALGQVWVLGEHRLVCGDCTDPAVVVAVMQEEKADCAFTSPPYAVGVDYGEYEDTIDNLRQLLPHLAAVCWGAVCDGGFAVINFGDIAPARNIAKVDEPCEYPMAVEYWPVFRDCGWLLWSRRIWCKPNPRVHSPWCIQSNRAATDWEHLWTWKKPGDAIVRRVDGELRSALGWIDTSLMHGVDVGKETHGAGMALGIAEWMLTVHSRDAALVLEPFCGTGTTLVACERLGRKCRAVELSPAYVAVTLQRWADMTGQTPRLLES